MQDALRDFLLAQWKIESENGLCSLWTEKDNAEAQSARRIR